jgi:peptidoglycan/xylan/chitin deacetylase (PgdA/CDA1 family)/glycosyltransferase involved in cell wall biosynthesis
LDSAIKLSVVISTYNRRAILARALPTVLEQDFPSDQYEVIVVVDGASDGTADYLRTLRPACSLRTIEQANFGPGAARNAGINAARGELVLFLDDDIFCEPGLVSAHVHAHEGRDPIVICGETPPSSESPPSLAVDWFEDWYAAYLKRVRNDPVLRLPEEVWIGPNCSAPRRILLEHGGFDERFPAATVEDVELAYRLITAAIPFSFDERALAHHYYVKSAEDLIRHEAQHTGKNEVLLCRRHPYFRQATRVGRYAGGNLIGQLLLIVACVSPVPPERLLMPVLRILDRMRSIGPIRRTGVLLLRFGMLVAALRSAVSAVGSLSDFMSEFGIRLPVLSYHHVGPLRPGIHPMLTVSPERFARQIEWLVRRGYTSINIEDWLAWCREGRALPSKPVLITFDDAYSDTARYALPALQRHGLTATVFVVTALVGKSNEWDRRAGWAALPLMDADQIRAWAARGFAFGSHGRTHSDLTTLDPEQLDREVSGSARELEEIIGKRPSGFAYPYGRYNARVRDCVAEVFPSAFAFSEGLDFLQSELSELKRLPILPDDGLFSFICLVRFGFSARHFARQMIQQKPRLRSALLNIREAISRLVGAYSRDSGADPSSERTVHS